MTEPAPHKPLPVEVQGSRHVLDWLAQERLSLALTTYQSGRLLLFGTRGDGKLSGFERHFDRAMGLWCSPERLYLSTKFQLWQLDQALERGQEHDGFDALYVPRIGWTTGDLDVHDVAVEASGRVVFAATGLNCLATLSDTRSCRPLWRPPFVSRLVPEDRCHLNGLALRDGRAAYVTCVSRSDVVDGWRDRRQDGGVVLDVASGEVIAAGLSMSHSPRWHDGQLYVHESGRGRLCRVDLATGTLDEVAFCPGYLRGLALRGGYAVVGLSKPRDRTFTGLPLSELLAAKQADPRCGVAIIDLKNGAIVHHLWLEGVVTELYDVGLLPGVRRPKALGFHTKEIETTIALEPPGTL